MKITRKELKKIIQNSLTESWYKKGSPLVDWLDNIKFVPPYDDFAMFVSEPNPNRSVSFILFAIDPSTTNIEVVGMIFAVKGKPCIAPTYQFISAALHKQLQGKGVGSMLYKLAGAYLGEKYDAGITSDHMGSTKQAARRVWDKIDKSPSYKRKVTSAGNDTFDYFWQTEDLDDDCDYSILGAAHGLGKLATDHSYMVEDSEASSILKILLRNSDVIFKKAIAPESLKSRLKDEASDLFAREYSAFTKFFT